MTPEDRKLMQQLRDAVDYAYTVGTPDWSELIAAADARLAAPVQSHEAWDAICEQSSGWMNQSGKGLMIAENDLITIGEQFAHPAAATELSQADIETIWRAHAPCNIVDYGASANDVNTWLFGMVKAMIATTKKGEE